MNRDRSSWQRVSRRQPCPVCARPDWCLFVGPADSPTAAICARIESDRRGGSAGWLHRLRDDGLRPTRRVALIPAADTTPAKVDDFDVLAERFASAMATPALCSFARGLGVSVVNLRRLRIGWSSRHGAWTFPMMGATGRVLGIRLRKSNGRKFAVKGGREGLFLPVNLDAGGRLLICEGPTDTAALLDLGFAAVGRPSCTGGVRLLIELVQHHMPADIVIVADGDGPGRRGAFNLASVLTAYVSAVRVIEPPSGINDARDWKRQGATHNDVLAVIESTPARRLQISTQPTRRAEHHGR